MGPVRQNPIQRTVRSVQCSYVCAVYCVQLLQTILHRTDLIIFPLALQTITTAPMMSIWGKGWSALHCWMQWNCIHVFVALRSASVACMTCLVFVLTLVSCRHSLHVDCSSVRWCWSIWGACCGHHIAPYSALMLLIRWQDGRLYHLSPEFLFGND